MVPPLLFLGAAWILSVVLAPYFSYFLALANALYISVNVSYMPYQEACKFAGFPKHSAGLPAGQQTVN